MTLRLEADCEFTHQCRDPETGERSGPEVRLKQIIGEVKIP